MDLAYPDAPDTSLKFIWWFLINMTPREIKKKLREKSEVVPVQEYETWEDGVKVLYEPGQKNTTMKSDEIKIRDLRKKDQYKIDDVYLNGYAKLCGVYATVVYNSLSRHADFHTQECFPSIALIAEQHNISEGSVISALDVLEKSGIIKKIIRKDPKTKRQLTNIYCLLDKSEWKNKEEIKPVKNQRGVKRKRDNLGKFKSR